MPELLWSAEIATSLNQTEISLKIKSDELAHQLET